MSAKTSKSNLIEAMSMKELKTHTIREYIEAAFYRTGEGDNGEWCDCDRGYLKDKEALHREHMDDFVNSVMADVEQV